MNPEDHAGSLAHFDASGKKIDPRLKSREADTSRPGRRGVNRYRNLGIVQIDSIQGGFLLEQIGVIDVQGKIADLGKDRFACDRYRRSRDPWQPNPGRDPRLAAGPGFRGRTHGIPWSARLASVCRTLDDSNSRRPTKAAGSTDSKISHLKTWNGRVGIELGKKMRIQLNSSNWKLPVATWSERSVCLAEALGTNNAM